jgi:hypothetical protein
MEEPKDDGTQAMILVSNVLILANQLKELALGKGVTGVDVDYTREAARLIFSERAKVFAALRQR